MLVLNNVNVESSFTVIYHPCILLYIDRVNSKSH